MALGCCNRLSRGCFGGTTPPAADVEDDLALARARLGHQLLGEFYFGHEEGPTMDVQLPAAAQQWANDILVWVGFGTLVGLMAKAVMPGRDPGGAVATLLMGIGGTIIGCSVTTYVANGERVTPISPLGFAVATLGAFVLLFFYRLLGGRFFYEGDRGTQIRMPNFARRRRYSATRIDE